MLDNLKKLIAALEEVVSPQAATQSSVKWVVKDILDCEQNPVDCQADMIGSCCISGGQNSANQCIENIMKSACESYGGVFYASKMCSDINGSECGSQQNQTEEPMMPDMNEMTPPAQ
jgi:hypothetical protein